MVAMRSQFMLGDGAVQRVPLLGADAAVLGEEGLVVGDCDVAKFDPGQDVDGRRSSTIAAETDWLKQPSLWKEISCGGVVLVFFGRRQA